MNISFLFGSGISIISGFPQMDEITKTILSGNNIGRHSDLNYYLNFNQDYLGPYVENNILFLKFLNSMIESYYLNSEIKHEVNYEDLFYVVQQIYDSELKEFENPALELFIRELKIVFKETFKKYQISLSELAEECLRYIHCIVWQKLNCNPTSYNQLEFLMKFHNEKKISNINLITLNHDLLLEKYLEAYNIPYNDGFQIKTKKIPELDLDLFKSDQDKYKLLKLHGSINWYNIKDTKHIPNIYKIPENIDVDSVYKIDDRLQFSDGLPIFLIGTFNKMLNYLSFIYEELIQHLKIALKKSEYLIISGYSFNDKGINIYLINWLNSAVAKKMIIIHPCFDNLRKFARGAYNIYFDPPQPSPFYNPKLIKIEKKFEEIKSKELIAIIK